MPPLFLASMKRDAAFLNKGFAYWKEATTAFYKQSSQCNWISGDVGELLNWEHQEVKAANRKMLLKVPQNMRFFLLVKISH